MKRRDDASAQQPRSSNSFLLVDTADSADNLLDEMGRDDHQASRTSPSNTLQLVDTVDTAANIVDDVDNYPEELAYHKSVGSQLVPVTEHDTLDEEEFDATPQDVIPPRYTRSIRPLSTKKSSRFSVPGSWRQNSSVFFIQWTPEGDDHDIDLSLCEVITNFLISTYRKNEVFILVLCAICLARVIPVVGADYVCREYTASYIAVMFIFGKSSRAMIIDYRRSSDFWVIVVAQFVDRCCSNTWYFMQCYLAWV